MFCLKTAKHFRRRLPQNGDTIVEVLICLAVVGFSLTLSYSLSRASLRKVRDAEERSQSTQMAQTQIERLKGFLAANPGIKANGLLGPGVKWLLNPPTSVQVPATGATDTWPGFCLYKNLKIYLTTDPQDPYCAARWTGEMYCDISANCATPPTENTVDTAGYPFRVGVVYPAKESSLKPSGYILKDNELYATAGRWQVGGDGTNTWKYAVVAIPYRIYQ